MRTIPTFKGKTHTGIIYPNDQQITLARRGGITNRKLTAHEREYAFWHEVTHGILNDMGHKLWKNEGFIEAFSKRLHWAIKSVQREKYK